MQHRIHPVALAMALAFASLAQAQTAGQSTQLGEVNVLGQRIQSLPSQQSISGAQLSDKRLGAVDSAELLRDVPGVFVQGAGGVSGLPIVHGLGDDRLRVRVDDMDLISACANHMNAPLSYIAPQHVDEIKVYTGVSPVSAGGDAIGASVIVNSKAPRFAAAGEGLLTSGELGAFYRSNGDAFGVNASASLATENFSLRYSGSTAESNNYRAARAFKPDASSFGALKVRTIAGDEVASTAYKSENHQLGAAYRLDNHLFDLRLGFQHIPYQGFPNQHMDMTDNKSTQINFRYLGEFAWGKLEARVYDEQTRHKMDFFEDKEYWYSAAHTPCSPAGPMCVQGMPMDTKGHNTGLNLKAELPLNSRDLLRLGSEVQRYRLDDWWSPSGGMMMWPNTFWNINNGQRDRFDLYGEWEANWNSQWGSLVGLRASRVAMDTGTVQGYNTSATYTNLANPFNQKDRSRTDNNIDFSALLRYSPSAGQSFEGGYSRKTRSPSLYERYTWATDGMSMTMNNWVNDGNGYVGNIDLKPEVAHTLSLTANWSDAAKQDWKLSVTPYFSRVDNYIDAICRPGATCTAGQYRYLSLVNQTAHLYGVDLSGMTKLGHVNGVGEFSLRGSLAYTRGKNQDTGDNLYNIMPLNGRFVLEHRLGGWTNTLEQQLVAGKDDVSSVRSEIRTPGYALTHLRTSYRWQNLRLDLGVDNLFDKQYALPLGGAYIGQGSTMSVGASTSWSGITRPMYGVAVPGMGRSIYAGINLSF